MFSFVFNPAFSKLRNTIAHTEGGIVKRIDENRELLELLQKEAPKLLESHPWIEGWIISHDKFFTELKNAEKNPDVHFSERPNIFPRPWPVSK